MLELNIDLQFFILMNHKKKQLEYQWIYFHKNNIKIVTEITAAKEFILQKSIIRNIFLKLGYIVLSK